MHVERYGSGEQCVFIHGAGGSSGSWYFQRELQDSMEVIFVDLPGHGDSPGPAPDSIEGYRDAVFETLRSLGIEKCYMGGHSMGGAIAMSSGLAYPEAVKGLVLVGTGARLKVMPEFLQGIKEDKEKTVRLIMELAYGRGAPAALKENGFKEMMKCEAGTIYNDYRACDRFDLMSSVENISVPTLIVCALSDLLTPPKYSEYLNGRIKGSKIELIEGAGHMMMLEKPAQLNKAVRAFMKASSPASL